MREKYAGEEDDAGGGNQTSSAGPAGGEATLEEQVAAGRRVMNEYSKALQNLAHTGPSPNSPADGVSAANRPAVYYWVRLRSEPEHWQIARYEGVDSWFLTGADLPMPDDMFEEIGDRVDQPVSAPHTSYDADFFEWTQETAAKVRRRRFHEIDLSALAEEIEDLGKREEREVYSRIRRIIVNLLRSQFQPDKRDNAWAAPIMHERLELAGPFRQSGSLREHGRKNLPRIYGEAVRIAEAETGLPERTFPVDCPYTYEQILDWDFYGGQACGTDRSHS